MPVNEIKKALTTRTADKLLDPADAKAVLAAAGKSVSASEIEEIAKALVPKGQYEVSPDAATFLQGQVQTIEDLQARAKMQNAEVKRRASLLGTEEKALLQPGVDTKSYGGSPIPEKLKEVVNAMRAAGAEAYDVAELDTKIGKDDHNPDEWALSGKWSPYPQEIGARGVMSFSYTELTPKKIEDDMSTERDQLVLTGYKAHEDVDRRTGKKVTWQEPTYEHRLMKGTGNIMEHYDEVSHPEVFALAPDSEGNCKYSANFAILADGSVHAVPAMRRTPDEPNLILTNPSLGRGKRMLFNGHIGMHGGVVDYVGMSGRLQNVCADGDAKFVNPIPILEAAGFKMAPGLRVSFEGSGNVKVDPATNLIVKG